VRKPEVKRLLGRPSRRWEYNIKMNFEVILCGGGGGGLDYSGRGQEQVDGSCKHGGELSGSIK
jgi:hypothetical protein